jgi:hypothetical protein
VVTLETARGNTDWRGPTMTASSDIFRNDPQLHVTGCIAQ